jgi:hypothetical protein
LKYFEKKLINFLNVLLINIIIISDYWKKVIYIDDTIKIKYAKWFNIFILMIWNFNVFMVEWITIY